MKRNQLNIRLDPLTQEILKAIAEAVGDDPKLPPSDVTSLVKKALKVYIEIFRKDRKYRGTIEKVESRFKEKPATAQWQPKLLQVAPRKNPRSAACSTVSRKECAKERVNEVA